MAEEVERLPGMFLGGAQLGVFRSKNWPAVKGNS